ILFQLSSVSIKAGNTELAQQYVHEANELAQRNQMESLIARGMVDLGNVYVYRGNYTEAEKLFQQGLEAAERYGGRQNEARARLSLASVCIQRGDVDRGLAYDEQALAFYQGGGFRTETALGLVLRSRAYKQKGDYPGALQVFSEQLKLAEQYGDEAQIAYTQGSIGNLLFDQESYSEARSHFEESLARSRKLGNQLYEGYAVMNLAAAQWWLGHHEEASSLLAEAANIGKQKESSFIGLQAGIALIEAQIALSEHSFAVAQTKSQQALTLAAAHDKFVSVQGKYLLGLAHIQLGKKDAGLAECQEASDAAAALGDPLLPARSQLAVAEAALARGEAKRALENAQKAQQFFGNANLAESNWRALLLAGIASQKVGGGQDPQRYLKQASDT